MALLGMFAQAGKENSTLSTLVPALAAVILFALVVKRRSSNRKGRARQATR
jgi:hypothetical protein